MVIYYVTNNLINFLFTLASPFVKLDWLRVVWLLLWSKYGLQLEINWISDF